MGEVLMVPELAAPEGAYVIAGSCRRRLLPGALGA